MENTSIIALTRQSGLRRQMDVIANNIANMNTTGFKSEKMMFVEHLIRSPSSDRLGGDRLSYVRDVATMRDTTEGPLVSTGNPLDVAIRGDGYMVVKTSTGNKYTRNGNFRMDNTGQLVTQAGDPVLSDSNQPFFFSPEDTTITISRDGTISTENGTLGRLQVVSFANKQDLSNINGGLLTTNKKPTAVANPNVVQNMLEGSNVQPILEMTNMIRVQRSYDGAGKLINGEHERIRQMIRELASTQ